MVYSIYDLDPINTIQSPLNLLLKKPSFAAFDGESDTDDWLFSERKIAPLKRAVSEDIRNRMQRNKRNKVLSEENQKQICGIHSLIAKKAPDKTKQTVCVLWKHNVLEYEGEEIKDSFQFFFREIIKKGLDVIGLRFAYCKETHIQFYQKLFSENVSEL